MAREDDLEVLKRLMSIQKRMNWDIIDVNNRLSDAYIKQELPSDFELPREDTFRKQYSVKGKGTKKYMPIYFDYIYNLDEVKEQLMDYKQRDRYITIGLLIMSIIYLIVTNYDPDNISFFDIDKECIRECAKNTPGYRVDEEGMSMDDFKIVRKVKKMLE